jgi:hypothetical protein
MRIASVFWKPAGFECRSIQKAADPVATPIAPPQKSGFRSRHS